MSIGVVMNRWPWLSMFTDSELSERADELRSELKATPWESAYGVDLLSELHWVEWHLKNRNREG